MKVALFGHKAEDTGDGLTTYSKELIEGLGNLGNEIYFFFHSSQKHPKDPHRISLGAFKIGRHALISSPRAGKIIADVLKKEQIDIAHASLSFSLLDFSLPDICHEIGIPIVATLHFPYDKRLNFWAGGAYTTYKLWSLTLNDYDAVIVFSNGQKDFLAKFGVEKNKIHVIPNGVDETTWSPGQSNYKQEIGADALVAYHGRIDPEKNVAELIEAFLSLKFPQTHKLVLVGDGGEKEELSEKYAREPRVIFTGPVGKEEQRVRIVRAADIYVLPSDVEGMSLSLLEAMSAGVASIGTDVGSDGEVLDGAGIVVDPRELKGQLPLAIKTLIDFPKFRKDVGLACRERVIQKYSIAKNIGAVHRLYQDISKRDNLKLWTR